jgi:hypothetical protein
MIQQPIMSSDNELTIEFIHRCAAAAAFRAVFGH